MPTILLYTPTTATTTLLLLHWIPHMLYTSYPVDRSQTFTPIYRHQRDSARSSEGQIWTVCCHRPYCVAVVVVVVVVILACILHCHFITTTTTPPPRLLPNLPAPFWVGCCRSKRPLYMYVLSRSLTLHSQVEVWTQSPVSPQSVRPSQSQCRSQVPVPVPVPVSVPTKWVWWVLYSQKPPSPPSHKLILICLLP